MLDRWCECGEIQYKCGLQPSVKVWHKRHCYAKKLFPKFNSQLMKIAKTGVINKKTASRKISRVTKKINSIKKK